MNFLIAYDIADPKRLRTVAKSLKAVGRRVQKSVFMFSGTRRELDSIMRELIREIEPTLDRVQAWPIRTSTRACRVELGNALPDRGIALVMFGDQGIVVEALDDESDHEPISLD